MTTRLDNERVKKMWEHEAYGACKKCGHIGPQEHACTAPPEKPVTATEIAGTLQARATRARQFQRVIQRVDDVLDKFFGGAKTKR